MLQGRHQWDKLEVLVFSEPSFLFLFLPLVLVGYFSAPRSWRNLVLLVASLAFYAWGEKAWTVVMLGSIGLNYMMGLMVSGHHGPDARRRWLYLAVALNLLLLVVFKYANFLADNLDAGLIFLGLGPALSLKPVHLPIGISFYTFQALSYVVDVYRGHATRQTDPLKLGLYIALFPQLIAGPIVRYTQVEEEMNERQESWEDVAAGIQRFVIGLSKKVMLANPAGARADAIFALSPGDFGAPVAWLGLLCYSFQIYFDFSGYSDMAIGLGRVFGFKFLENFNYPYVSRSITEFWRRWHISLSTWFRDYLYIPMGGNRVQGIALYRNLVVVFVLCGFWHGASWNFLIWGLMHGALLVAERVGFGKVLERLPSIFSRLYVLFWVGIAWVFFRAETLGESLAYLRALFGAVVPGSNAQPLDFFLDPYLVAVLAAATVGSSPFVNGHVTSLLQRLRARSAEITVVASITALLLLSSVLIAAGTYNPFIYFRF